MNIADEIIRFLRLTPHPKEGGFFRETYRSSDVLARASLPDRYPADRNTSTAIYYLLTPPTMSALHLLETDEIFHWYLGGPVRMLQLSPDGTGREVVLGPDLLGGQSPQVVVPRGTWQGSFLESGHAFALLGCTVAPGFDYADYRHGSRDSLIAQYPGFEAQIRRLTLE